MMPKSRKIPFNPKFFSRLQRDLYRVYQYGLRAQQKWHHFTSSHMNADINIVISWQQCLRMIEFVTLQNLDQTTSLILNPLV